jgi:uncharacterized protein
MSVESLIPYDEIVQEALRAVIGRVLQPVVEDGLPGNHHFFITYKTKHAGVKMPNWLLAKYPDEITIVIQHRYWGLAVHDEHFEVGLSFNQKPELLHVPYAAVTGFVDPEVNFALQFQVQGSDQDIEPLAPHAEPEQQLEPDTDAPKVDGANVVSLDRFRKK